MDVESCSDREDLSSLLSPQDDSVSDDVSDIHDVTTIHKNANLSLGYAPDRFTTHDFSRGSFKNGDDVTNEEPMTSRITLEMGGDAQMRTPLGYNFRPFAKPQYRRDSQGSKFKSISTPNLTKTSKSRTLDQLQTKKKPQQGFTRGNLFATKPHVKSPDVSKLEWMKLNKAQTSKSNGINDLEMDQSKTSHILHSKASFAPTRSRCLS